MSMIDEDERDGDGRDADGRDGGERPADPYDASEIKVLKGLKPARKRPQSGPHPHAPDHPTGTPSESVRPDEHWLSQAATTPADATALLERYHATLDDRLLRPTIEALADKDHAQMVGMNRSGGHVLSAFNEALVLLHYRGLITYGEFRDVAKRVAMAKYPVTPDDPGTMPVPANKLDAQTHGELRELEYCYVPMRMLELQVEGWDAINRKAPQPN